MPIVACDECKGAWRDRWVKRFEITEGGVLQPDTKWEVCEECLLAGKMELRYVPNEKVK